MNFALRLLILSLALTLLTGVSPQKCDRYAATAVDQAKRNFQGNCGGTGGRWSDDFRSHYDWCLNQTEPGAALKAEQQGTCRSGYVWRDSFSGDNVCVTPAQRAAAKKK
jgi:hypothetical protein